MWSYRSVLPQGGGWPCSFMHVVLLPIYKPVVPSMWISLLKVSAALRAASERVLARLSDPEPRVISPRTPQVGEFVIWRASACTSQGIRRAAREPLGAPPLPVNGVTFACIALVALPLVAWCAPARAPARLPLRIRLTWAYSREWACRRV